MDFVCENARTLAAALEKVPFHPAHEHIPSLANYGAGHGIFFVPDTAAGALPVRPATLLDLVCAPYWGALVPKIDLDAAAGSDAAFLRAFAAVRPALEGREGLGVYAALGLALKELYGAGGDWREPEAALRLSHEVARRYADPQAWLRQVLSRAGADRFVKPVHPQFYTSPATPAAAEELRHIRPITRVDAALGVPQADGRLDFSALGEILGRRVETFDDALEGVRLSVQAGAGRAVGLKQLQAYFRPLRFEPADPARAAAAFGRALAGDAGASRLVGDALQHALLRAADEKGLVYQLHTGMAPLAGSDPALLEPLFGQYPNVTFVLLHAWPFTRQAAYLARTYPNCVLDTSWLALQGPAVLRAALEEYLAMVPEERITLSIDATGAEEFYGGARLTRRVLAEVLAARAAYTGAGFDACLASAGRLLYRNADRLYGRFDAAD